MARTKKTARRSTFSDEELRRKSAIRAARTSETICLDGINQDLSVENTSNTLRTTTYCKFGCGRRVNPFSTSCDSCADDDDIKIESQQSHTNTAHKRKLDDIDDSEQLLFVTPPRKKKKRNNNESTDDDEIRNSDDSNNDNGNDRDDSTDYDDVDDDADDINHNNDNNESILIIENTSSKNKNLIIYEARLQELKRKKNEFEKEIECLERGKQKLNEQRVASLIKECKKLHGTIDNLKQQIIKQKHENNKLKTDNESNMLQMDELNFKYNELQTQYATNKKRFNVLNEKYSDLQQHGIYYKRKLKESNERYEKMRKQNEASMERLNVLNGDYKESQKQLNELKDRCNKLKRENGLYQGNGEEIEKLNGSELNALELKLQNGITSIVHAKERLTKCISCYENDKDMVFLGETACSHVVLCSNCEARLEHKSCPICQAQYNNAKKIRY